jgi:hypothetical protein
LWSRLGIIDSSLFQTRHNYQMKMKMESKF